MVLTAQRLITQGSFNPTNTELGRWMPGLLLGSADPFMLLEDDADKALKPTPKLLPIHHVTHLPGNVASAGRWRFWEQLKGGDAACSMA